MTTHRNPSKPGRQSGSGALDDAQRPDPAVQPGAGSDGFETTRQAGQMSAQQASDTAARRHEQRMAAQESNLRDGWTDIDDGQPMSGRSLPQQQQSARQRPDQWGTLVTPPGQQQQQGNRGRRSSAGGQMGANPGPLADSDDDPAFDRGRG